MAASASIEPLYRQIRSQLEDRILSGAWPPGTRIPSEDELTRQFDCSRMTVNKAISALADSGLVVRRRKIGTVVAHPPVQHAMLELRDLRSELAGRGGEAWHRVEDRTERTATVEDRDRLASPAKSKVLSLSVLHMVGEEPALLERRLINLTAVPEARDVDFGQTPPGTWLLDRVPWTSAEHRVRAVAVDPGDARRLSLEVGEPCLVIERRTFRQDVPMTWVRLTYPGSRHELFGRFKPSAA